MRISLAILMAIGMAGCGSGADGKDGASGPAGALGATGPAGVAGRDGMTIDSGFGCYKVVSGKGYTYRSVLYTTGDRWVTCSVDGSATQSSSDAVFKAGQSGASNALCYVTYDLDTATAGYFGFTITGGRHATYVDSGSASNGTVITFTSGDCIDF